MPRDFRDSSLGGGFNPRIVTPGGGANPTDPTGPPYRQQGPDAYSGPVPGAARGYGFAGGPVHLRNERRSPGATFPGGGMGPKTGPGAPGAGGPPRPRTPWGRGDGSGGFNPNDLVNRNGQWGGFGRGGGFQALPHWTPSPHPTAMGPSQPPGSGTITPGSPAAGANPWAPPPPGTPVPPGVPWQPTGAGTMSQPTNPGGGMPSGGGMFPGDTGGGPQSGMGPMPGSLPGLGGPQSGMGPYPGSLPGLGGAPSGTLLGQPPPWASGGASATGSAGPVSQSGPLPGGGGTFSQPAGPQSGMSGGMPGSIPGLGGPQPFGGGNLGSSPGASGYGQWGGGYPIGGGSGFGGWPGGGQWPTGGNPNPFPWEVPSPMNPPPQTPGQQYAQQSQLQMYGAPGQGWQG